MKRKGLTILLASAAILTGCAGTAQTAVTETATAETTVAETTTATETTVANTTATETTTVTEADTTEEITAEQSEEKTSAAATSPNRTDITQETAASMAARETEETAASPYGDLTLNKYTGLEMTAAILPRNAILPGMTIPVTITISNNGDQAIAYIHGSSSSTTPMAIHLDVNGLQSVLPEDKLGFATMDYAVKELKPGESIQFTLNVKAIEPNENFDNYTRDLFFSKQLYIGNLNIEELFETYDDLIPAASGAYEGIATFVYYLADGPQNANMFAEPNGYIQAPITIFVN